MVLQGNVKQDPAGFTDDFEAQVRAQAYVAFALESALLWFLF